MSVPEANRKNRLFCAIFFFIKTHDTLFKGFYFLISVWYVPGLANLMVSCMNLWTVGLAKVGLQP
jgi:hypothetical protein